jgi:predicted Fe-S protein YdhL (DUF1289 family)
MTRFPEHERRMAAFWQERWARMEAAERQGVCTDCNGPLTRPLDPVRPDVCLACGRQRNRLAQWREVNG